MADDTKNPACTDYVLHHLYLTEDALRREQFREALNYAGDALAKTQNEIDWCYRTDPTLPFIREYLMQLTDTIQIVQQLTPAHRKRQVSEVITALQATRESIAKETAAHAAHKAPDTVIDSLERDHRALTYGK